MKGCPILDHITCNQICLDLNIRLFHRPSILMMTFDMQHQSSRIPFGLPGQNAQRAFLGGFRPGWGKESVPIYRWFANLNHSKGCVKVNKLQAEDALVEQMLTAAKYCWLLLTNADYCWLMLVLFSLLFLSVQTRVWQLNRWHCHSLTHSLSESHFWFDTQRATLETCDLWDIWSEWWGDMTWPT